MPPKMSVFLFKRGRKVMVKVFEIGWGLARVGS